MKKNILIIAGEASSDMHAANLVSTIRAIDSDISFFGLGGDKMQKAGVNILHKIVHLAFIGPAGLFTTYSKLKRIYDDLCRYTTKNIPDCAILIDYAEFNLRVAEHLKRLGVPVIYYISPQVWAWGAWRINTIRKLVNEMLVLFKFEKVLYESHGVNVKFVGHPLLDIVKSSCSRHDVLEKFGLSNETIKIGVLPGSRKSELENILPIMLESCKYILKQLPDRHIEFLLPLAPTLEEEYARKIIASKEIAVKVIHDNTYDILSVCDAAMVASGTATLETAIMGVPMTILYKANFLTYICTRSLIRLKNIGLVNIVAGRRIVPEFLQYQARPSVIADYMIRLLTDKSLADSMRSEFVRLKEILGEPGAVKRTALEVLDFIR